MNTKLNLNLLKAACLLCIALILHPFVFVEWYLPALITFPMLVVCLTQGKVPKAPSAIFSIFLFVLFSCYLLMRTSDFLIVEKSHYLGSDSSYLDLNISIFAYMISFVLALIYGFSKKRPLKSLHFLAVGYLFSFAARSMLHFSEISTGSNLWAGILFVVLTPIGLVAFHEKKIAGTGWDKVFLFLCLFYLTMINSRASTLGLLSFGAIYTLHPYLTKSRRRFIAFFLGLTSILATCFFVYISIENTGIVQEIDQFSLRFFKKSLFTGRAMMWRQLVDISKEQFLFGHGTHQSTSYFHSIHGAGFIQRNLSSHNTYLEVLVRGGITGLLLLMALFFSIWSLMYTKAKSVYARIGPASLIAVMFNILFAEYLLTNNFTINFIIWAFWGVCCGQALRSKRTFKMSHKVKT